jgi:dihydrofolate reductase
MRKLISYMFTSLDGYVADSGKTLDWVPIDDELMAFANVYFAEADGIVFGRQIFGEFVEFWDGLDPNDPNVSELDIEFARIFAKMQRIVVSRTLDKVENATLINGDVVEEIARIKNEPGGDLLLICGPELRATLSTHGLIDQFRTLIAPVVLGDGLRLLGSLPQPERLRLESTRVFEGGVVMLDHVPDHQRTA